MELYVCHIGTTMVCRQNANAFVFESIFKTTFSKYLYLTFRNEKYSYLYLNTLLKYLTF